MFELVILAGLAFAVYLAVAAVLRRWFTPQEDPAECLVLELPTPGHHIALTHLEPETRRFAEPVILCHGLGANRFNMDFAHGDREPGRRSLARALCRAGFDVWILETRGHGKARVPNGADWNADDEVREDVPTAIEAVLDQTDAKKVYWVGHSYGGILMYLFFSRGHELTQRIAGVVTVGSPGMLRVQRDLRAIRLLGGLIVNGLRDKIRIKLAAYLLLPIISFLAWVPRVIFPRQSVMEGVFLLHLFASLPEDVARGWARQGLNWARDGYFSNLDGDSDEEHFERLDCPMLLLAGSNDRIAPPEAIKFVADAAGSTDTTFRAMGVAHGDSANYGHGGLLVSREAPDEVFPIIRAWLAARGTRSDRPARTASGAGHQSNGKINGVTRPT